MKEVISSYNLCTFLLLFVVLLFGPQASGIEPEASAVNGYEEVKSALFENPKIRVIVKVKGFQKKGNNIRAITSALNRLGEQAREKGIIEQARIPRFNMAVYEVDEEELERLLAGGEIEAVYEDQLVEPLLQYSVPFINGDAVQAANFMGAGQTVAILDSGVDLTHPAFGNRIVAEACFSNGDDVSSFSLCPNGQSQQIGFGAGDDCYDIYNHSDCSHGTHVAGISAGFDSLNSGLAPSADIASVQVFHRSQSGARIYAYTSDMILALQWVLENAETYNIAAVNMSIGGTVYTEHCDGLPIKEVIDALRSAGVATIIAAGNDGSIGASYPGCVSSAITVAATQRDSDQLASFSNASSIVDLAAPGASIYAPIPGAGFGYKSGTSMAAPHVAGAFALLRSATPSASVDEIELALESGGINFVDSRSGAVLPRVDLYAAYEQLAAGGELRLEAEDQHWGQADAEDEHGGFTGSAYVNTENVEGSWLEFVVEVPMAGDYEFTLRFANGSSTRSSNILVNSQQQTTISYPSTGAWNKWQEVSFSLALSTGAHTLRFVSASSSGAANIDHLRFVLPSTANRAPEVLNKQADVVAFLGEPELDIDLNSIFSDPDGDPLTFNIEMSEPGFGIVSQLSESVVRLLPLAYGQVDLVVTASDGIHPSVAIDSFQLKVLDENNTPPVIKKLISGRSWYEGINTSVSFHDAFIEIEGEPLTYSASSSNPEVVEVGSVIDSRILISTVSEGQATITLVASDGSDESSISFSATVAQNAAPIVTNKIPDYLLEQGGEEFEIIFEDHFEDPDGDILNFDYEKDDDDNLNVTMKSCCVLTIDPNQIGSVQVIATADDGKSGSEWLSFNVTVIEAADRPSEVIQIEDASWNNAEVETEHSGYTGSGYVNTENTMGAWVELVVNVSSTGTYSAEVVFANGSSGRPMDVFVNGVYVHALLFGSTGDWDEWNALKLFLQLDEGVNTLRLEATSDSGAPNLDKISFNRN